jgi:hypothetical protein
VIQRTSDTPVVLVTSGLANALGSASVATVSRSSASGSLRCSVEIEDVEDEDDDEDEDYHSCNISRPSNASQLIESGDGSNDDEAGVVGQRARASSVINVNDDSSETEGVPATETAEAERGMIYTPIGKLYANVKADRLLKEWNAPVYAFFNPVPSIDYVGNPPRRVHIFECNAKACIGKGMNRRHVRRFLDTADGKSTSNLRRHAKICWGEEAVAGADTVKSHGATRQIVEKSLRMRDGSIAVMFKSLKGKGKVTYSHRQHTKTEARYNLVCFPIHMLMSVLSAEIVRWVAESMRPFKIVNDRGFRCLMKTGRPGYYIPSPETVSRDTKKVFARCRKRIAKMLQVISVIYRL